VKEAVPGVRHSGFERHYTATAYVVAGGRTLLIWHERLGMWLPPGGHCEPNEDPVEAVLREAREESGLDVDVVPPPNLIACAGPRVLPPPAVILIEDIHRPDQPYHQHIDQVYFTVARGPVDFEAPVPHGAHRWTTAAQLERAFSLPAPDGRLVEVAEDVRLLGVQAIAAAAALEGSRA
jgi:8-oxo-dGTP pyrophosphatase MutT (NUDIX family)